MPSLERSLKNQVVQSMPSDLAVILACRQAILNMPFDDTGDTLAFAKVSDGAPIWLDTHAFRWLGRLIAGLPDAERRQAYRLINAATGWRGVVGLVLSCCLSGVIGLLINLLVPLGWAGLATLVFAWLLNTAAAVVAAWFWPNTRTGTWQRISLFLPVGALSILPAALDVFGLGHTPKAMQLQHTLTELLLVTMLFSFGAVSSLVLIGKLRTQRYQDLNAQFEGEVARERVARELAESQLKLLQAQIEPHFLFNTLGALQHRAEGKAPEAAALAADLIRFLRGSMENLRAERTTLGEDFKMVGAYLGVMQARLGNRLSYRLELPDTLASQVIPTMMLLTLVENALKHGIEPHPPGGEVSVVAAVVTGGIQITVADTGRGVSDLPGSGVGLDNIRTRLQMLYGEKAWLDLSANTPQGFVATIVVPLST